MQVITEQDATVVYWGKIKWFNIKYKKVTKIVNQDIELYKGDGKNVKLHTKCLTCAIPML